MIMALPGPSQTATLDEDDTDAFEWGWRAALVVAGLGVVAGLIAYVAWRLGWRSDLVEIVAAGSVVAIFVGPAGRVSTVRRQRWAGVHVTWRPGTAAPLMARERGSVGRSDMVAGLILLLLCPLSVLVVYVSATSYHDGAAVVLGQAAMLTGILALFAIPGLAPRVVVTGTTVSVRNLFVRQDVPRHLLAWFSTQPTGRHSAAGLCDGDIEFGLTNGARVSFAAGPSQLGRGSEYLNRRPAKIRVAHRLTRLLDSVPAEHTTGKSLDAGSAPPTQRRYGVMALIVMIAVVAMAGAVAVLVTA